MKWQKRLLVILIVQSLTGLFLDPARGQEERLILIPPLSQVFPLDPKPDGMRLKFPILLNYRTVLGPDVVLRFIYIDPTAGLRPHGGEGGGAQGGGSPGGGNGHHRGGGSQDGGDAGSAAPRSLPAEGGAPSGSGQDGAGANKDATSEIRTEVWNRAELFREALDEAADMGTTLVYSAPGKQKPLSTMIDLPDGMLLAQVGAHITVLAMTNESKAFQSGIRPDDEIRSIAGTPSLASLIDFAREYSLVQEQASKAGKSYSVEIWRPSESRLVTIQVAAPPSLRSMF